MLLFVLILNSALVSSQTLSSKLSRVALQSVGAQVQNFHDLRSRLTVVVFFSESCPICQKYTPTLRDLRNRFESDSVRFLLVFPDTMTSDSEITAYEKKYKSGWKLLRDYKQQLTTAVDARTTPEVFVISSNDSVVYRGRIDNWFSAPGRMRGVITSHELQDCLEAYTRHRSYKVASTHAIGCLIERVNKP